MTDLVQVSVTDEARRKLEELHEHTPYFKRQQDVYRLGVAIAIALGHEPDMRNKEKPHRSAKKWRVTDDIKGTGERLDDKEGTLAELVTTFRPRYATEPYRYSQVLASTGINYLHGKLLEDGASLHGALEEVVRKASDRTEK